VEAELPAAYLPSSRISSHVVIHELLERRRQLVVVPTQRRRVLAVDEDRAVGRLARAGLADADVRRLPDSPGPLTTQPMTASVASPSCCVFHGIWSRM
jgi:hypothetical protein